MEKSSFYGVLSSMIKHKTSVGELIVATQSGS